MKKNIGILFPYLKRGGVFQYALSIVDSLTTFSNRFNYLVLYYDTENPREFLKNKNLKKTQFICLDSSFNNLIGKAKILLNLFFAKPIFTINKKNKNILKDINLDLLIIPFPLLFGFENKVPYIVSIVDVMHKYYPHFPEYNFLGRLKRYIFYKFSAQYSFLTIVDSEQGRDDLNKFYKIPKEKIRAISYIPPGYVFDYKNVAEAKTNRLLEKYSLPEKFLFYPAQFWYHKNHQRLVKSLNLIKEKYGLKIPLVLVGSSEANRKNFQKVMKLVKKFNMQERVYNLGYVSDQEIVALYKKSLALVFPTLIGPTSIPPLEAMVLGKPVLCSNLFEMPKQIGKAGIFFNPFSEQDMAEKIYQVWTNRDLREKLVAEGKKRAEEITLEKYAKKWEGVIREALNRCKV